MSCQWRAPVYQLAFVIKVSRLADVPKANPAGVIICPLRMIAWLPCRRNQQWRFAGPRGGEGQLANLTFMPLEDAHGMGLRVEQINRRLLTQHRAARRRVRIHSPRRMGS